MGKIGLGPPEIILFDHVFFHKLDQTSSVTTHTHPCNVSSNESDWIQIDVGHLRRAGLLSCLRCVLHNYCSGPKGFAISCFDLGFPIVFLLFD